MATEENSEEYMEAIVQELLQQGQEREEAARVYYPCEFWKDLHKRLEVEAVNQLVIESAILSAAHGYLFFKSEFEDSYVSQKKRDDTVRQFSLLLHDMRRQLDGFIGEKTKINPAIEISQELVFLREEEATVDVSKKFVDAMFYGYEGHFINYQGDVQFTSLEDFREKMDMRNPYKNLDTFIACLAQACERVMEQGVGAITKKDTALNMWLLRIEQAWCSHSPVPFTVGHYYEGIGYNSEALCILHMIMQKIDPSISMQSIATGMRKRRSKKIED